MTCTVWTIVVAGGSSTRYGRPKQFELLGDRPVIEWSLDAARSAGDGIVVALPADAVSEFGDPGDVIVVAGGATRAGSVRAGLAVVPPEVDVVVVHDAARPLASPALFCAVVAAVRDGADGAVPGVAVVDTVKRVDGARIIETLEREALVAVQTPQAFRASALRAAHEANGEATDDAALVEEIGGTVVVVPGEADNLKLTSPADLERLESVLAGRRSEVVG